MAKRKDPITREELFDHLSNKVCELTYTPKGGTRKKVTVTLLHEYIKDLDNFAIGFMTIREAALFDMHSINCLDIDSNQWLTIEVSSILNISIP